MKSILSLLIAACLQAQPAVEFKFTSDSTNIVPNRSLLKPNAIEIHDHGKLVLRIDKDMNLVFVDEKGSFSQLTEGERILVAALIKASKKANLKQTSAPLPIINKSEAKKGKQ